MINELAKKIHENAVAKGFWDQPRNVGEQEVPAHYLQKLSSNLFIAYD